MGEERGASLVQYVLLLALVAVVGFAGVQVLGGDDAAAPVAPPRSPGFENVLAHHLRGESLTPEGSALLELVDPPTALANSTYSITPKRGTMSFATLDGGRVTSPNVVVTYVGGAVTAYTAGGVPVDPNSMQLS